jgi:hypothetical protein
MADALLNAPAKWIVLERNRSSRTGERDTGQPVFGVPGVAGGGGPLLAGVALDQRVAVRVVGEGQRRGRGQVVRHVMAVGRYAERVQPVAHRIVLITLSDRASVRDLGELVNGVVGVVVRRVVGVVRFGSAAGGPFKPGFGLTGLTKQHSVACDSCIQADFSTTISQKRPLTRATNLF